MSRLHYSPGSPPDISLLGNEQMHQVPRHECSSEDRQQTTSADRSALNPESTQIRAPAGRQASQLTLSDQTV